ncbi:MAG TPA: hypothetical protein VIN59_01035 [Alphaproteobacteria bacterium]
MKFAPKDWIFPASIIGGGLLGLAISPLLIGNFLGFFPTLLTAIIAGSLSGGAVLKVQGKSFKNIQNEDVGLPILAGGVLGFLFIPPFIAVPVGMVAGGLITGLFVGEHLDNTVNQNKISNLQKKIDAKTSSFRNALSHKLKQFSKFFQPRQETVKDHVQYKPNPKDVPERFKPKPRDPLFEGTGVQPLPPLSLDWQRRADPHWQNLNESGSIAILPPQRPSGP